MPPSGTTTDTARRLLAGERHGPSPQRPGVAGSCAAMDLSAGTAARLPRGRFRSRVPSRASSLTSERCKCGLAALQALPILAPEAGRTNRTIVESQRKDRRFDRPAVKCRTSAVAALLPRLLEPVPMGGGRAALQATRPAPAHHVSGNAATCAPPNELLPNRRSGSIGSSDPGA